MTNLEIFIYTSFTLLVYFLSKMNDKYQASTKLLDAFVEEIENLNILNKEYQNRALELELKLSQQQKSDNTQRQLLEEKYISQIKDIQLDSLTYASTLEKLKLEKEALINSHEVNIRKTIEQTRKDTIKRSRSVLRGQATEHLAPYILQETNPKDYRFLGSPIDYICFEGLSDVLDGVSNEILSLHFIDIKTGKASLSKSQRKIRDAIKDSRVKFSVINLDKEIEEQNDKIKNEHPAPSSEES